MFPYVYLPWEVTGERLPPILEVRLIRSAKFLAVKLLINKGATGSLIERIRSIIHPFASENIAPTGQLSDVAAIAANKIFLGVCVLLATNKYK